MKAFIVLSDNSPSKNNTLVSLISTLAGIESIGIADDVPDAVSIIQRRYPNTPIFNSKILKQKGHGFPASVLENNGSFIILPKHHEFQDKCIYLGIDLSVADQKEWVLNKIGEIIHEYQHLAAI